MDINQLQQNLAEIEKQIEENKQLIAGETNPELIKLAEEEIIDLQKRKQVLEEQAEKINPVRNLRFLNGVKSIIVEVRAGTGGEEAALFAGDLFRMYSRFAEKEGWKTRVLDSNASSLKGIKEIIFKISGENAYEKLKQEGGVHRVQRIPETEKSGRIHTSTATVAVLPEIKNKEIEIKPSDLKISSFRASGPGGQYVNKTESAVRIVHIPSGIIVTSQSERHQAANRENALSILRSKLYSLKIEKELQKIGRQRKSQIGTAERSEKIRTYNFPQDRITDHRIGKSWHNIENILNGNLEPLIKAFRSS